MLIKSQDLKSPFWLIRSEVPVDAHKRKINTNWQTGRREIESCLLMKSRRMCCSSRSVSAQRGPFPSPLWHLCFASSFLSIPTSQPLPACSPIYALINSSLVLPHHHLLSVVLGEFMGCCVITAIIRSLFIWAELWRASRFWVLGQFFLSVT